jgi:hypothetical protein
LHVARGIKDDGVVELTDISREICAQALPETCVEKNCSKSERTMGVDWAVRMPEKLISPLKLLFLALRLFF